MGSCPLGPGANLAVLQYLSKYPAANGTSQGDGFNLASYTFSSPSPASLITNIARLDYNISDRQQLWVRGNLQQDNILFTQQFPGGAPTSQTFDNTRGIAAGDTLSVTDRLVNSFRYAFIRQGYANRGDLSGQFVYFNSITPLNPTTTSLIANIPVNNAVDDVTWTKGRHTLQFGGNYRGILTTTRIMPPLQQCRSDLRQPDHWKYRRHWNQSRSGSVWLSGSRRKFYRCL